MRCGRRYEGIWLGGWAARSCAGDAEATYASCAAGESRLRPDPDHGWLGLLGERPFAEELGSLLAPLARDCGLGNGHPALAVSASKGDIAALDRLLAGQAAAFHGWQSGALIPRLAAALGIDRYVGGSPVAACSTGLYALLHAADCLDDDLAEWGLAGAADASCQPLLMAAYHTMGVTCGDRRPSAFTGEATGFALGEGAAMVALQRRPGPWQLLGGVRLGDASHVTRCEDPAVLRACLEALWELLPEPQLIIAHATGTAAGDRFERAALDQGPWSRVPRLCCKPVIGHCLGASGIVELAAGLCAPVDRLWKLSLGFGGHVAAVACQRLRNPASA